MTAMSAHNVWRIVPVLALLLVVALGSSGLAGQEDVSRDSAPATDIGAVFNGEPVLVDSVFGLRLAVLPLADVSQGSNGISLELTHDLAAALQDRGIDLVPEGEVLQFMADNRVRFAGYLDSLLALKMGRQFDCGLIMLGTVTEFDRQQDPRLGLTLTVMDARSGSPVWAATRAASVSEQVRLLGLGEPQELEDLKQPLLQELLNEFQRNLPEQLPERVKPYQIISAQATPAFVQGGDVVDFRLEIRFVEDPPRQILIDTKVGVVPLYRGQAEGLYLGHWVAPAAAGSYPLALLFDWGRGDLSSRLNNIAAYQVINESPQLQVSLKKGLQVGDVTAFRGSLIILPELRGTTPISHWALTIRGENGAVVVSEEHDGNLPSKLVWQGTDAKRRRLQDGLYQLSVDVWDAAGNHSGTTHKLALQSSTVPVQVASVVRDGKTYLQLDQEGVGVVPVANWSVKVSSLQGNTLLEKQGGFLPALLELPHLKDDATILCDIQVEDSLGNYLSLNETQVKVESPESRVARKVEEKTSAWVEDF